MQVTGGPNSHPSFFSARRQRGLRVALTATALISLGIAQHAPAQVAFVAGQSGAAVAIPLGKSQLVRAARPFSRAMIGNQEIADVLPINGDTVYVLGKKLGSTNLTLYDRSNNLVAVVDVMVGPDAASLQRLLGSLLPGEPIQVRAANDSLLIEGTVSNAVMADRAARVADSYAPGKVINLLGLNSPQQVLLEVRFSEMRRGTVKQLGIRTLSLSNSGNFGSNTGDVVPSNNFGTIGGSFGIGPVNINLALDALEEKGLVTTLAQPNLIALSGETASFLAGGEFPVPVASTAGTTGSIPTITVEFKQFGVSLAFTPTVLADGMVNLIVAPEVSAIDPSASLILNGISIPGLRTRRARTTLELRDGQSFAIAGLVSTEFNNTARQVPLLADIPILGALFRSTSFNKAETELVITVTPHLIRPVAPAALALPTDRVQPASEPDQFLLGKIEKAQGAK
ncbi:type II and III secretion system protein family protein [Glacieibacterium sp.]|uniref:type II and III secretion system protein family protein n=1 Tax=Glacieibacterium sp. TaxID=2860237 RepID=UPI003B00CC9C